jgi:hypothetical protein
MPATSIKAGLVQAPRGMGYNRETNAINHFGFAHEALNLGVYPGANRIQPVPNGFFGYRSQIGKAPCDSRAIPPCPRVRCRIITPARPGIRPLQ